ncbi:hypothetical protein ABPG75_003016 [Micractinium tetrahymenae]
MRVLCLLLLAGAILAVLCQGTCSDRHDNLGYCGGDLTVDGGCLMAMPVSSFDDCCGVCMVVSGCYTV